MQNVTLKDLSCTFQVKGTSFFRYRVSAVNSGRLRFGGLRSRNFPSKLQNRIITFNLHYFVFLFLTVKQFFASSCDFCSSSFPLGCLGLNSRVAVHSGRKVNRRFGVRNVTFRWRFFYILFCYLLKVILFSFHRHHSACLAYLTS